MDALKTTRGAEKAKTDLKQEESLKTDKRKENTQYKGAGSAGDARAFSRSSSMVEVDISGNTDEAESTTKDSGNKQQKNTGQNSTLEHSESEDNQSETPLNPTDTNLNQQSANTQTPSNTQNPSNTRNPPSASNPPTNPNPHIPPHLRLDQEPPSYDTLSNISSDLPTYIEVIVQERGIDSMIYHGIRIGSNLGFTISAIITFFFQFYGFIACFICGMSYACRCGASFGMGLWFALNSGLFDDFLEFPERLVDQTKPVLFGKSLLSYILFFFGCAISLMSFFYYYNLRKRIIKFTIENAMV